MTPSRLALISLLLVGGLSASAEEKVFGFDPVNWSIICSDYQGSDQPIDSQAIRAALIAEGWDQKTREAVKQECLRQGRL